RSCIRLRLVTRPAQCPVSPYTTLFRSDKLDPLTSAQIIISHVSDGLDLAQKYHLPPRIQDFIREHHGTSLVKYFYIQAQRAAGRSEEHTSELQSRENLVCRLLLEKKNQ